MNHSSSSKAINSSGETFAEIHEMSKSHNFGFESDVLMQYNLTSNININTGIRVRILNEWYNGTVITETPFTTSSDSASFYIVSGLKQYIPGVLTGVEIKTTNYRTPVNRFFLDIPLEIEYVTYVNRFMLKAGLSYNLNLIHSYSGKSYNKNFELLDSQELKNQEVYKNRFVNNYNFKLGLGVDISSKMSIGLDFNYWLQSTSSLNSSQNIDERYKGMGMNLFFKNSF